MLTIVSDLISLHMMKTLRNIFSYGLVLMFLVPSTGFYYTMHSCLRSGEVQLVLDGDYSCCSENSQVAHNPLDAVGSCCSLDFIEAESTCCNLGSSHQENSGLDCYIEGSSSSCCLNEGNYLKSEDEYTSPGKIEMPHIKMLTTAVLYSIENLPVIHQTIEENAHSPPFAISSIDILHKHSVLII